MREAGPIFHQYIFSTFVVAMLLSGSWSSARAQSEITLLAPSPTRRPLDKIVSNFQAKTVHKVKVTYSGARTTTQAVAKGDPLDVSLIVAPVTGALTSGAVIASSMTVVASYQTAVRSEEHTSELQSQSNLVCRLLL